MPLARQEVEFTLNHGMADKESDALQDANSAIDVQNLHMDRTGELVKRAGVATTATVGALTGSAYINNQVQTLFTLDDEVCGLTADNGIVRVDPTAPTTALYTAREFLTSDSADKIPKYAPKACRVSRRTIERAQYTKDELGITLTASTIYGGTLIVCWATVKSSGTAGTINFKALDLTTGQVLATKQYASSATVVRGIKAIPHLLAGSEGALFAVMTGSGAPYTITPYTYIASTRDFAAGTALTTNAKYVHFDLITPYLTTDVDFYFAFTDNTTGFVKAQRRTLAAVSATHDSTKSGLNGLSLVALSTYVLIAFAGSATQIHSETFGTPSATLLWTQSASETPYTITMATADGTTAILYTNVYYAGGTPKIVKVVVQPVKLSGTTPTISGLTQTTVPNAWVAAKPFALDGRVYCPISSDFVADTIQSIWLFRHGTYTSNSATRGFNEPVARIMHDRFSNFWGQTTGSISSGAVSGNSVHFVFAGDLKQQTYAQTLFHSTVEFAGTSSALALPYTTVGGVTQVASGMVYDWDGETPSEHAPMKPPALEIDSSAGTGTTVTNLSMVAVYTWVDAKGNLHRSSPSPAVNTGVVTNKQIDVYVERPLFSAYGTFLDRGPGTEVALYITEDNGTAYYRSAVFPVSYGDTHFKFTDIDPGHPAKEPLYSTGVGGQEITADPPPAFRDLAKVSDRLVGIDAEDPTRIWFTKPFVAGYAPEWSAINTTILGDDGMAVRELGGIICVLGKSAIWVIDGQGPDALGAGSFSLPRKVANVGCIDPGVCLTPAGILYRSQRGYQLIDSGFNVQPIGTAIENSTRLSSPVGVTPGRVVYDDLAQEAVILDKNGSKQWLLSVTSGQWSRYTDSIPLDLCVTTSGVWELNSTNGISRRHNITESTTSTSGWTYTTPWISLAGLAGFGRVWELILGLRVRTNVSNSTLTVTYSTRAPESTSETFTWTGAELATLGSDTIDLRLKPTMQRCKAFKLSIVETCSAAYVGSSPLYARLVYGADKSVKATRTAALKGKAS